MHPAKSDLSLRHRPARLGRIPSMKKGTFMLHGFRERLRTFLRTEDGPTAVEYAVLIALVVLVCIGAVTTLGSNSNKTFTTAGKAANPGAS